LNPTRATHSDLARPIFFFFESRSMKTIQTTLILAALLTGAAHAQSSPATAAPVLSGRSEATATSAAMTEGEIRKVDKDNKKITIKHGEIKNLDMPGMTMVFSVSDPAMLDKLKTGDKVRFMASNADGKITVTHIQPAK
jgi:Cu(I)/Ag(I) efflux system protein CusF